MSSSIQSIQAAHAHVQAEQSVQPPKTLQTEAATQTASPKDTVTISQQARQALVTNSQQANGAAANSNGTNH
jgi:hypothetical protein